ncbi:MAG: tetratricopeptide repeat protein [Rhodospirillaceae bacterium]|nr:tetratricopeptide repeat protein [Rhodospirillaceae bacterium]
MAKKDPKLPAPAPDDPHSREQEQFFEEVSEELKQDRYAQLWKRYGRYLVALAVAVVVGVAGYRYWQSEQRKEREIASERFASALALAKDGKLKEAAAGFAALAQKAPAGYAGLARLQQGAQLLKAGDRAGAIQAFEQLANDEGVEPLFRDVAVVHWAYTALDDADPAKMIDRLKPLTAAGKPWRFMALELTALYADRAGRRTDALEILSGLEKDREAPSAVRSRAKELLAVLGKS